MGLYRSSHPGHEGYVIALVHRRDIDGRELVGLYRELGYPLDDTDRSDVQRICAGCDCGWRSPHWTPFPWWVDGERHAPEWSPFCAWVSPRDEERMADLWNEHLEHTPT